MEVGSILLILSVLIIVAIFVSRPFYSRDVYNASQKEHDKSALMAERDRVLNALKELDFDHDLGKIPEAVYSGQRAVFLQKGAEVLRKLDTLYRDSETIETEQEEPGARRERPGFAQNAGNNATAGKDEVIDPDDELEALIAARRRERQQKASGFCSQCGGPLQQSDKFCPKCGTSS